MSTALGIANRALRILGEPALADLTGTDKITNLVNENLLTLFHEVMTEEDWYFLLKRTPVDDYALDWSASTVYSPDDNCRNGNTIYNALLSSTNVEPGVHASSASYWEEYTQDEYSDYTGYWFKYVLPSDIYRVVNLMPEGYGYILEADWLYCNYTPDTTNEWPRVRYMVDVISLSGTIPIISSTYQARIPEWFDRVVACKLATELAMPITNKRDEYERAERRYYMALQTARGHNAMATPGDEDYPDTWTDPVL